jgi:5-methylcytosine-specific restriction endonuclease McrA
MSAVNHNTVKASARTTLVLDFKFMPVDVYTAEEAFTALFRRRLAFFNGSHETVASYAALNRELSPFDGDTWLAMRNTFLNAGYPAIRGASGLWPVPTVIRICGIYKVKPRRRPVRNTLPSLASLLKKHNYTCALTNKRFPPEEYDPEEIFDRDHIVPRASGGPNTEDNIVLASKAANRLKGHTFPYTREDGTEVKAIFRREPFAKLRLGGLTIPPEWHSLLFMN